MRVPVEWLHEYCRPALDLEQLAERLTMTGTNVESIEHHGVGALEQFVVGRVLSAEKHPNADRLSVCLVDTGASAPSQIVCGAPNVAAGQTVAVARPGAVMPDGRRLGKAKLRGVESDGMILAEDELAIGPEHDGIIVLESDGLAPGTPLREVLPIATEVLEVEIGANRPDCLAVYGMARELHAATGAPLAPPPWSEDPGGEGDIEGVSVTVEAPELCPRFTARVFEDVRLGPSPPWLKARLMACGQRPISNVVDITNYVMLASGQPLHAFDLDRVADQSLTVRRAREGEAVRTLDGQTRRLDAQMLLIADAAGPTSIAGVMGGERSEVSSATTRVLMEAATWDGPNIHRTAWTLGLQSEASLRFEKQLAPEQTLDAQALAARLMIELCGARLRPGTIDVGGPGPPPPTIRLRDARTAALLGHAIPRPRCRELLEALECRVAGAEDGLEVRPPAFRRGDLTREVDLIEEVARLDGLEKLPATLPSRHGAYGRLTPRQRLRRRAADALAAQGLDEVAGWSFSNPDVHARLRIPGEPAVRLQNPLSSDKSQLRTELLSSLLEVARRNLARGASSVRLFEAGTVFLPQDSQALPREPHHVAGLLVGALRPATWRTPHPPRADFFAAKGVLSGLLEVLRAASSVEPARLPFLHPGRAASVLIDGRSAGWVGEIHPRVAAAWDLDEPVAGFELDLDSLPEPPPSRYSELPSFPAVREDLAVVVSDEISAGQVVEVVRRAGAPLLETAVVFDVYRDPERIGPGKVSLALRLTYRAAERTLTDEEVAAKRAEITAALAERLAGRVRAG
jgi:phenylalanyl-tRNA synthetase beta chain